MNLQDDPCKGCRLVGHYAPWALLGAGSAMSVLPVPADWAETSAYLVALGLLIFAASYFLMRLKRARPHSG